MNLKAKISRMIQKMVLIKTSWNICKLFFLLDEEYGDFNSLGTTEPEPEEEKIEMETEFSKEDDLDEYYMSYNLTQQPSEAEEDTATSPDSTDGGFEDSSGRTELIYEESGQTEEEEPSRQEESSVIDKIIEEEQKTPGEKLLEKIEKSKILERILPADDKPNRDSLLSKIIRMFGK